MNCRFCHAKLSLPFVDLGFAPPSNSFLDQEDMDEVEKYFALKVMVCDKCWLVQTKDNASANDLFKPDYAYFSSTSASWVEHALIYTTKVIEEFSINQNSFVVEVASNDGYLLKNFVESRIPCLGIEPTINTSEVAKKIGIPVINEFFGKNLAQRMVSEGLFADLVICNNVYAHVPDIVDFTRGLKLILKAEGTITIEFPHLLKLLKFYQFDTIYHEHFSYLSIYSVNKILNQEGIVIWKIDQLETHGGSLRIYCCHQSKCKKIDSSVSKILKNEKDFGLQNAQIYENFQRKIEIIKHEFLLFLLNQKKLKKNVFGYGAAAKGNTFLNYCGVKPDLIEAIFDASISKQFKYMPGSHIPIFPPKMINNYNIDSIIIFPWNIAKEIKKQLISTFNLNCKFYTAIPELKEI